jgi:hypothetical protein
MRQLTMTCSFLLMKLHPILVNTDKHGRDIPLKQMDKPLGYFPEQHNQEH